MKKTVMASLFLCLVLLGGGVKTKASVMELDKTDNRYPESRRVHYSLLIRNTTNRPVPGADLVVSAPVRQTATQKCLRIVTSHPCELSTDVHGNQLLHFSFNTLAPYESKIVTVRADLSFSKTGNVLSSASGPDPKAFLRPEPHVESDHPEVAALATKLRGPEEGDSVQNIFRWVTANIAYSGYQRDSRGALRTLRTERGDCTDYASLFVALCRAIGVPARGVAGYIHQGKASLNPEGYHNWAEVYFDGAWRIVDPQRSIFEPSQDDYIALSVLSSYGSMSVIDAPRYRVSGNGVEARIVRD